MMPVGFAQDNMVTFIVFVPVKPLESVTVNVAVTLEPELMVAFPPVAVDPLIDNV